MLLQQILTLFFPHFCVGCSKEGEVICGACRTSLQLDLHYHEEFSGWSFYIFNDKKVQRLLRLLKYDAVNVSVKILVTHIHCQNQLTRVLPEYDMYYWLPIPVSSQRLKERGYNQVVWIAEELQVRYGGIILTNLLYKQHRESFVGKTKDERIKLAEQMFSYRSREIPEAARVVLIDDVTTTGSTLKEAQRILQENGVAIFTTIALAREQ